MFSLDGQPPRCPVCLSLESRLSRKRGIERLPVLLGLQPWRCRTCARRFWHWSVASLARLVVVIGAVAGGVLWLRWVLSG
jgi:hypothetical protein